MEKFKAWNENAGGVTDEERGKRRALFQQPSHPVCQVSGHLMVNRVPGNFYSQVQESQSQCSHDHLSYTVNSLSFGDPIDEKNFKSKRILKQVPAEQSVCAHECQSLQHGRSTKPFTII
jgi:hypothetical protein